MTGICSRSYHLTLYLDFAASADTIKSGTLWVMSPAAPDAAAERRLEDGPLEFEIAVSHRYARRSEHANAGPVKKNRER